MRHGAPAFRGVLGDWVPQLATLDLPSVTDVIVDHKSLSAVMWGLSEILIVTFHLPEYRATRWVVTVHDSQEMPRQSRP